MLNFLKRTAASVPTPDPDRIRLYMNSTDGTPHIKDEAGVDSSLVGVVATRQIIAGAGLTGGGNLTADRTLDVVANADGSIVVAVDSVQVGILATDAQHGTRGGGTLHPAATTGTAGFLSAADKVLLNAAVPDARQVIAGAGMTGGGTLAADRTLNVIAHADASIVVAADSVQVGVLASDAQHGVRGGGTQHAAATAAFAGFMAAADFVKLHGIWKDIVADYGADPLGSVDATSLIQTAVDAFPAAGGVLYFPPGTFRTTGTVTISKPVIIKGAGRSISVIRIDHATQDQFLLATGAAGAGFEQIRLFGNQASFPRTAGYAVNFAGIANAYLQQCDILFHWSGVRSAGALQFLDDMNIREMGANAANGQCVLIDAPGDRYLRRLTTDNPSDPTGFAGVRVRQCSSLVLTDCNLINGTNALDIVPNGGGGTAVASILATSTFFDSSSIGVNILPATSSDTAHRIRFINCWFGSNTVANVRIGNGTIPNANIASIDILGCDFFAPIPSAAPSPFGLDVQGATEWSVRGSRFGGHGTNAIRVAVGAGTADHNFAITDNLIGNCLGAGANAQGVTVGAGTYGRYQILDNRGFETNTTVGIADSGVVPVTGQKNVRNNMGALLQGTLQLSTSGGAAATTARGAITSGTAETFMFTCRIPGNALSIGQQFRISVVGQHQGAGALTFRIKAGAAGTIAGDTQLVVSAASAVGVANRMTNILGLVTVIALGPTATVVGSGFGTQLAAVFGPTDVAEVTANVPTTAPWFITFSMASSASTWTLRAAAVEAL